MLTMKTLNLTNKKYNLPQIFEKLPSNKLVDDLMKLGFFSIFWYDFRSFLETMDFLRVMANRIGRTFNMFGATGAVALDIS